MTKKAQAEIIVTILIILLVLAAVVIVWQVVQGTIQTGVNQIPGQTECMTMQLDIVSAKSSACVNKTSLTQVYSSVSDPTACVGIAVNGTWVNGSVVIKRNVEQGDIAALIVYIDGEKKLQVNNPSLEPLDQKSFALDIPRNASYIKVTKIIGKEVETGKLCDFTGGSAGQGNPIIIRNS